MSNLLFFPGDDSAPPAPGRFRPWAKAVIADYRKRHNCPQTNESTVTLVRVTLATNRRSEPILEPSQAITMRELTPPIQSDQERAEGESTNSRMHRLLNS